MRQVPSDKYNIAWFKLAEFVSRGEKERALGLYRLLTHSFDDPALAYQLEGDLLLSFNDESAHDRYRMAAEAYRQAERFVESVAMYEQLLTLSPKNEEYIHVLLSLYTHLNVPSRLVHHLIVLIEIMLVKREYDRMNETMQHYESHLPIAFKALCFQKMVILLIKQKGSKHYCMQYIKKAVDALRFSNEDQLQFFLLELEALNAELYEEAFNYIEH